MVIAGIRTLLRILSKRITTLVLDCDTEPTEAVCKAALAAAGIQLLLPYNTFATVPTYAFITQFISNEEVVGALILIVALIGMVGVLFQITTLRLYGAGLGALIYGALAFGIYRASPLSLGVVVYGVLSLAELWVIFRRSNEIEEKGRGEDG